jgi:hypothetical protein
MKVVTLYKFTREDGGTTVSKYKPEGEYTEMVRLIADYGKVLKKNGVVARCVDTKTPEGWVEVEGDINDYRDIPDSMALNIIMGGAN